MTGAAAWLMRWMQRVATWAIIRIVVAEATREAGRDARVDMLHLRSNLADRIDTLLIQHLRARLCSISAAEALVVALLVVLTAVGIRLLPF